MSTDVQKTTDRSASLPPRAAIALLSLQLRAAQQEADAAESALGPDPTEAALAELRAKLLPRLEQRRVELDAEFERAQHDAGEAVATARAEAVARLEALLAEPEPLDVVEVEPEPIEVAEVEPEPLDVVLDDLPTVVPALVVTDVGGMVFWPTSDVADDDEVIVVEAPIVEAPIVEAPIVEAPIVEPAPVVIPIITELDPPPPPSPFAPPTGAAVAVPAPTLVDAEVFARAIASVLAAVLAERGVAPHAPTMQQPYYLPYPMPQQQAPAKAGFWSSAKHIDVILLFVAMMIVLVILVAWLA